MKAKVSLILLVSLLCSQLVFSGTAHAYLDPGTGSLIFQMIIAAGVGALFFLRVFWRRIKGIFAGQQKGEENE